MLPVPLAFVPSPILNDAVLRERFLDVLADLGDVSAAAAEVGVPRSSVYKARRMFPDFAHGWSAVLRHRPAAGERSAKVQREAAWSGAARARFFDALAASGQVAQAAAAAGKSIDAAYRYRATAADFARDWDAAIDRVIDAVEAVLFERALHGVAKPVFYGGAKIADVHDYSETLAMFLLRLRRGVTGRGAVIEVTPEVPVTREELVERVRALLRRASENVPTTIEAAAESAD